MRFIALVLTASILGPAADRSASQVRLRDLHNQLVDPFVVRADAKAIVFLFTSVDCPISNRYAPEIRRIFDRFAAKGVRFWLVYPNPAESPDAIRNHVKAFAYPMDALRDPQQTLVKATGVTVTPEAAVFEKGSRLVYHGRIDDRYVSLGLERPAATRHDLEEALMAVLAGQPVPQPTTQAVGCFLADFVR